MYYFNQYSDLFGRRVVITIIIFFAIFFSPLSLMAEELNSVEQKNGVSGFTRSTVDYKIPDVMVVRQDGEKLSFIKELDDGRPVILNFIFASCTAICPMISHVFSRVQAKLGENSQKVHLMSISVDPENDTSTILTEYAKKFGAGPNWDHFTGTLETSIAIQKAFDAYRGDKMNHVSVILIRTVPGKPWLRTR